MDAVAHLDHLRADSATLLAAYQADPAAPAWPGLGWDRAELLAHVADVHGWVRAQLRLGPKEQIRFSTVERAPTGDALPDWFEAGAAELLDLLSRADLTATWPTWSGPQPGTFFGRRMAQETSVHRWDAAEGAIDAELAADGIDELLELFIPRIPAERLLALDGTIHLHATDTEGEWLVRLAPGGITFERGHAKGDLALRGAAQDLLLWSWNRIPADGRLEVLGDAGLVEAWGRAVRF